MSTSDDGMLAVDDDDYDDADVHDNSEFKHSTAHFPTSIWGLGFEIGFGP